MPDSHHPSSSPSQVTPPGLPRQQANFSLRRDLVDNFLHQQILTLPQGGLVLDLGGNKNIKRGGFNIERHNFHVIYANLSCEKGTDLLADASHLPLPSDCFQAVICTELLEHLSAPEKVVHQIYRVLKSQGNLIVTVPFLYRVHPDPEDFGRYTEFYWRRVLAGAGFTEVKIEKQGLYYSVLADFARQYVNTRWSQPWLGLARQMLSIFQRWALHQEQKANVQEDPFINSFTTGYGIRAVKPAIRGD